jgi:hypothetical protein
MARYPSGSVKLLRTAKAIKAWRRKLFSNIKLQETIIRITMLNLEKAQKIRNLTDDEFDFRKYLKLKSFSHLNYTNNIQH